MDISPKTYKLMGQRLVSLRKEQGLTQKDFANIISELSKRTEPISISAISAWESGRRRPTSEMINIIAKFFQVTPEYLQCLNNDRNSTDVTNPVMMSSSPKKTTGILSSTMLKVPIEQLRDFDGKPVLVTFNNLSAPDQWGIVNVSLGRIILKNGYVDFNNKGIKTIYLSEPDYFRYQSATGRYPMSFTKLYNFERPVYVELTTSNDYLQGLYNGWYKHNENHTCLINHSGLTLPYEGVTISYNAYHIK